MKEIKLTQGKVALVDDEDFETLNAKKWCAKKSTSGVFYVYGHLKNEYGIYKTIQMHQMLIHVPKGMQTDHIDGNGLNNQKSNLRIATPRKNQQNQHVKKASKYVGVFRNHYTNKWGARIKIDGRYRYLGAFKSEESAGLRYFLEAMEVEP